MAESSDETVSDQTDQQRHERRLEIIRVAPKLILILGGFIVAALLANQIADFAGRTTKVGLGPVSVEAEAKLQQINKKDGGKPTGVDRPPLSEEDQDRIIARYDKLADVLPRARVLWVDDNPPNNATLVDFLDAVGVKVDVARSFDEAALRFEERTYDAVISDYSRERDKVQFDASAAGDPFPGSGAQLAKSVFDQYCRRKVILFSSAGPDFPVPPFVFAQTNDPASLLNHLADLIERQDDQRCETEEVPTE